MLEERIVLARERISVYLMMLKITPNLKGYVYLSECAIRIFEDSTKKFNINNKLYNDIALKYDEKPSLIQRAVRHAIEVSAKRDGLSDFEKFTKTEFYSSKPSPRELLCVLVERTMIDCNVMLANKEKLKRDWVETFIN